GVDAEGHHSHQPVEERVLRLDLREAARTRALRLDRLWSDESPGPAGGPVLLDLVVSRFPPGLDRGVVAAGGQQKERCERRSGHSVLPRGWGAISHAQDTQENRQSSRSLMSGRATPRTGQDRGSARWSTPETTAASSGTPQECRPRAAGTSRA